MTDKSTTIIPQTAQNVNSDIVERVVIAGDLSRLSPQERVAYYRAVCQSVGLNPLTRPFDYITLNGKLTLYARRDATDQLRKIHGVSIDPPQITYSDDLILVTVTATDRDGRRDSEIGAVSLAGLKGADRANAIMKAITKAKRRVTLSIVGLGWLDETEIESIPDAKPVSVNPETGDIDAAQPQQPSQPQPTPAQTDEAPSDWTKSARERELFAAWRQRNLLTDTECKRLLAAYLGLPEVRYFRDVQATREEIQNMIEAQLAREVALRDAEEA